MTRRAAIAAMTLLPESGAQDILTLPAPPADRRIRYGDDPNQFGDLRLPSGRGPWPGVVMIHGGFWRSRYSLDHTGTMCAALARDGYAVWSLEYRRVGNPGGGWPGSLDDVLLALGKLDPAIDARRLFLMGHSAGGHLALLAAKRAAGRLTAVIGLAAITDLRRAFDLRLSNNAAGEFMSGVPTSEASPIEQVPLGVTTRLIHGTDDPIVPVALSRTYAAKAGSACTLTETAGGHFELIDPRTEQWAAVRSALY